MAVFINRCGTINIFYWFYKLTCNILKSLHELNNSVDMIVAFFVPEQTRQKNRGGEYLIFLWNKKVVVPQVNEG